MASRKPHARFVTSLALMGALAGVLIWSKLRLSTNMPRSAYADPKDAQVDPAADPVDATDTTAEAPVPAIDPDAASSAEHAETVESEVGQTGGIREDG